MKTYLTIDELSKYLKVSKPTIRKWMENKQIPHIRIKRVIRFDTERIDVFMRERENKTA